MNTTRIEYDLPAKDYRKAVGVSKSELDLFDDCAAKFKADEDGALERETTMAMQFGTLLHSLVLDGRADYHIKPADMTFATKEGRAWRSLHQDKPIVSQDDAWELGAISQAIIQHRHAAPLLAEGRAEVSLFGVHKLSGIPIKGRVDWLGRRHIVDLKTTADASRKGLAKSIAGYRYHIQAAMYLMLAQQSGLDVNDFYFVAIERGRVPFINVRLLTQAAIELGRQRLDKELCDLKVCRDTGVWPDYSGLSEKPGMIDLPAWCYTDMTGAEMLTGAAMEEKEDDQEKFDIIP